MIRESTSEMGENVSLNVDEDDDDVGGGGGGDGVCDSTVMRMPKNGRRTKPKENTSTIYTIHSHIPKFEHYLL